MLEVLVLFQEHGVVDDDLRGRDSQIHNSLINSAARIDLEFAF